MALWFGAVSILSPFPDNQRPEFDISFPGASQAVVTLTHQETSYTVSDLTSGLALGIATWAPTAAPDLCLQVVPELSSS